MTARRRRRGEGEEKGVTTEENVGLENSRRIGQVLVDDGGWTGDMKMSRRDEE